MALLDGPSLTWELWSTRAYLAVAGGSSVDLASARAAIEPILEAVELSASRFRADSDVSRIATAGGGPVEVSAMTIDLIGVALRSAEQTEGLVDPTLGGVMTDLGYDRTIDEVRRDGSRTTVLVRSARRNWRDVVVDPDNRTVQVPAGLILDLGATAKARASDLGVAAAVNAVNAPVVLGLGGDLAVAGTPEGSDGWPVRLAESPGELDDEAVELPQVAIATGGLATSTTMARRWRSGDRWVHHVIDPRTQEPAREVWRTATVAAATCVDANTASTAAVILGDGATAWLVRQGLPARLVSASGDAVAVAGWPKESL